MGRGSVHRWLAAGALAVMVLAGCGGRDAKPPERPAVEVGTVTVSPSDVPVTATYVAQTQSSQQVNIQARVSGFLEKREYVEGSVVKAGQVLFRMDRKPFLAQRESAAAALQRQKAAMVVAKDNLDRTRPLVAKNALSQKDLNDATGQFEQSAASVDQARAQLETADLNLSYATITSPVTGVSSYAQVADGSYVSASNSQLTTVAVLSPMWVNFSISENEIQRVRDEVRQGRLRLPPGGHFDVEIVLVDGSIYPYRGRIVFASPSYNPQTGTFLLRASVENPDGLLLPNQYVRSHLKGAVRPHAIAIPQRAVQQGAKGHFVWVVNGEGKAELRPIVVGNWTGDDWFVEQGLAAGDVVVVDGTVKLGPGVPVKATPIARPAPAKVAEAPRQVAPVGAGSLVASVRFQKGQAILGVAGEKVVRDAARSIGEGPLAVVVTGLFAPSEGEKGELGRERAIAVRDALVAAGIPGARLRIAPSREAAGGDGEPGHGGAEIALSF